jgi:hypothetical protein
MQFNWSERARAYDNHEITRQLEERQAHREQRRVVWDRRWDDIFEEIVPTLAELRQYTRAVRAWLQNVEVDGEEVRSLIAKSTPGDIRNMIAAHAEFIKLVNLWLGEPTEIHKHELELDELLKGIEAANDAFRRATAQERGDTEPDDHE